MERTKKLGIVFTLAVAFSCVIGGIVSTSKTVTTKAESSLDKVYELSNGEAGKVLENGESAGNGISILENDATLKNLTPSKDKYWTSAKYIVPANGEKPYLEFEHRGTYEGNTGIPEEDTYSEFRFTTGTGVRYIEFEYRYVNYSGTPRGNIKMKTENPVEFGYAKQNNYCDDIMIIEQYPTLPLYYNQNYPVITGSDPISYYNHGDNDYGPSFPYIQDGKWHTRKFYLDETYGEINNLIFNFVIDGKIDIREVKTSTKKEFLKQYDNFTISDLSFKGNEEFINPYWEKFGADFNDFDAVSFTFKALLTSRNDVFRVGLFKNEWKEKYYIFEYNARFYEAVIYEMNFSTEENKYLATRKASMYLFDGMETKVHYFQIFVMPNINNKIGFRVDHDNELEYYLTDADLYLLDNTKFSISTDQLKSADLSEYNDFILGEAEREDEAKKNSKIFNIVFTSTVAILIIALVCDVVKAFRR